MKAINKTFTVLFLALTSLITLSGFMPKINGNNQNVVQQNLQLNNPPILITPENIDNLKKHHNDVNELLKSLDKNMDYRSSPMNVMALEPHYNSKGTNENATAKRFQDDARMAYKFALGYAVSHNAAYARKAQGIIDAWSTTLKRVTTNQSKDEINFNVPYMVIGASLVKDEGNWDTHSFNKFLKDIALPASSEANINNHGLWGIFMESTIYAWLGDEQGMKRIRNRWMDHLQHSIDDHGVMPNEIQRSATSNWHGGPDKGIKGLAYTHYALLPATLAAVIFKQHGMPVWNTPSGQRLGKAFAQAAAWTRNPETFPYYKSNHGKLIGVNNDSYFVILNKIYPNADADWIMKNTKLGMDGFQLQNFY